MRVAIKLPRNRIERPARLTYLDVSERRDVEEEAAVVPEIVEPLAGLRLGLAGCIQATSTCATLRLVA